MASTRRTARQQPGPAQRSAAPPSSVRPAGSPATHTPSTVHSARTRAGPPHTCMELWNWRRALKPPGMDSMLLIARSIERICSRMRACVASMTNKGTSSGRASACADRRDCAPRCRHAATARDARDNAHALPACLPPLPPSCPPAHPPGCSSLAPSGAACRGRSAGGPSAAGSQTRDGHVDPGPAPSAAACRWPEPTHFSGQALGVQRTNAINHTTTNHHHHHHHPPTHLWVLFGELAHLRVGLQHGAQQLRVAQQRLWGAQQGGSSGLG